MSYKQGDQKYDRLNVYTSNYVDAMNRDAPPEELHHHLRDLLAEAIRVDIPLEHLLWVLSGSSIEASDTGAFIENVSRHYAYGVVAAKAKHDENKKRNETVKRKKPKH